MVKDDKFWEKLKVSRAKWVDLRFSDLLGTMHHITLPVKKFTPSLVKAGKPFDGSSILGWKGIQDSDMILIPDITTGFLDPFYEAPTFVVICDVFNTDGTRYNRDPRSIARAAEAYLKKSKIADTAFFGPELEFFVFDSVRWKTEMGQAMYEINSSESDWETDKEGGGHRIGIKCGYLPVPPSDSLQDLRSEMCRISEMVGLEAEVHHHEVGTAGQCEIGTKMGSCVTRADHNQIFKYVVRNVANRDGKTATFMPKPLAGDNGSGMHIHQSLAKNGKNLFSGNKYAGLSQAALYYIGGIIKHARALNAFCNPTTNSYKRLIPGFEAPTILAYSAKNRSAAIRIPHISDPKQRRFETRFPDPTANAYLAFSTMLLAGLDGIKNKIDPGKPRDEDLFALTETEAGKLQQVAATLNDALAALDKDRKFLTSTGVFDDDFIDSYIELKISESRRYRQLPHPVEFDMYFNS